MARRGKRRGKSLKSLLTGTRKPKGKMRPYPGSTKPLR